MGKGDNAGSRSDRRDSESVHSKRMCMGQRKAAGVAVVCRTWDNCVTLVSLSSWSLGEPSQTRMCARRWVGGGGRACEGTSKRRQKRES